MKILSCIYSGPWTVDRGLFTTNRQSPPRPWLLLLVFSFLSLYVSAQHDVYAQTAGNTVLLELHDDTLDDALHILARKFNRGIGYDALRLPYQRLTLAPTMVTLQEGLGIILRDTGLEGFLSAGGNIALRDKPKPRVGVSAILYGTVSDKVTGETLPGANVVFHGTTSGTITDVNGSYRLVGLTPGSYTLSVSFVGYDSYQATVVLTEGEEKRFDIRLTPAATRLSDVVVEAKRIVNSEVAVLKERQKSTVVQDAISAQEIERTASVTATQALQKVTGVSVKDGKYVAVRGLTDRNIVVQLNGARLSSADPLRSGAVPLDILPAQLLDNISVQKTVLPDKPGDATGALVELKTRSLPDTFMVSITAQAGWNDNIGLGGDVLLYPNGKLGFFGQHAKEHRLSKEFVEVSDITTQNHYDVNFGYTSLYNKIRDGRNSAEAAAYAAKVNRVQEEIDPYLAPAPQKAMPNQIYSVAVSNTFNVFGKKRLGILGGVNYYSRTEQITNATNNRYQLGDRYALTPNNLQLSPLFRFREDAGSHSILYGAVGIVTYKINDNHAVSGHYIRNQGYENAGTLLSSINQKYPFYNSHANFYTYQLSTSIREFNTVQLRGEHAFRVLNYRPKLSWNYSTSSSHTDLPDFRNSLLLADTNGVVIDNVYRNEYYTADVTRYYRQLDEDNRNVIIDAIFPVTQSTVQSSLKIGGWYLRRNRHYNENQLLNPTNDPHQQNTNNILNSVGKSLLTVHGNLNNWLTPDAIGIAENYSRDGSTFVPGYNYYLVSGADQNRGSGAYQATQRVTSLYAMLDATILEQLQLTGGMRVEDTDVRGLEDTTHVNDDVRSFQDFLDRYAVDQQEIQWLPSGTLIYKYAGNMNFRFAASKTLARPELVELITFSTYDASQFAYISGNNKLRNATYTNLDFRWEYFPKGGEVFAVSVFHKRVTDALERVFLPSVATTELIPISTITFRNNPSKGTVYGVELEAVRELGFIDPKLRSIRVGVNMMLAKSETTISDDEYYQVTQYNRTLDRKRPLFEQPNIVFNGNIGYSWSEAALSATAYFNYTGRRLVEVNTDGTPSIYEYQAPQMDFILSKTIKRFQVKAFAKNLWNGETKYIYQSPGSDTGYGIFNDTHYRRRFARGREFAFGFSYVF